MRTYRDLLETMIQRVRHDPSRANFHALMPYQLNLRHHELQAHFRSMANISEHILQPVWYGRYDFVLLFDVQDGNPNGDPDAGNLPRIDPQSLQGLVTDGCLKRKLRNAIAVIAGDQPGCELYFQTQEATYEQRVLNLQHQRARDAAATKDAKDAKAKARAWMCQNFYDIRAFGAVMTTGVNCGLVRGPVQLTFAHSIDPIVPLEFSITRKSVTTEDEAKK
jgi:CRISPR-associated protein Csd2